MRWRPNLLHGSVQKPHAKIKNIQRLSKGRRSPSDLYLPELIRALWPSPFFLKLQFFGVHHETKRFHCACRWCAGVAGRRVAQQAAKPIASLGFDRSAARSVPGRVSRGLRALDTSKERTLPSNSLCARRSPGFAQFVSELKRGNVDLAVSSGPATRAMSAVTEIPVLFAQSGDPVALGIVKSLAQPGTNFTGTTFLSLELAGKRVELLKDVFPRLRGLRCSPTPTIQESNRNGAPPSWRPPRHWTSSRSTFHFSARASLTARWRPRPSAGGCDARLP